MFKGVNSPLISRYCIVVMKKRAFFLKGGGGGGPMLRYRSGHFNFFCIMFCPSVSNVLV